VSNLTKELATKSEVRISNLRALLSTQIRVQKFSLFVDCLNAKDGCHLS